MNWFVPLWYDDIELATCGAHLSNQTNSLPLRRSKPKTHPGSNPVNEHHTSNLNERILATAPHGHTRSHANLGTRWAPTGRPFVSLRVRPELFRGSSVYVTVAFVRFPFSLSLTLPNTFTKRAMHALLYDHQLNCSLKRIFVYGTRSFSFCTTLSFQM